MAALVELADAAEYVVSHWGPSRPWSRPDLLVDDFRGVSASAIRSTLEAMFRQGRPKPPGPSEVLAGAIAVTGPARESEARRCVGAHTWARPGPVTDDRRRWCAVCGEPGAVDVCEHSWNSRGVCRYCPATTSPPQPA